MICELEYKPAGWFGKDLNRVEGFIYSKYVDRFFREDVDFNGFFDFVIFSLSLWR